MLRKELTEAVCNARMADDVKGDTEAMAEAAIKVCFEATVEMVRKIAESPGDSISDGVVILARLRRVYTAGPDDEI